MNTNILHIVEGIGISLPWELNSCYQPARAPDALLRLQPQHNTADSPAFEPHTAVNFQHFPSFQVSDVAMGSSSEQFPIWMYSWLLTVLIKTS